MAAQAARLPLNGVDDERIVGGSPAELGQFPWYSIRHQHSHSPCWWMLCSLKAGQLARVRRIPVIKRVGRDGWPYVNKLLHEKKGMYKN